MSTAARARTLLLAVLLLAATAAAQTDVMCFCPEDDSDADCGGNIDVAAFSQVTIYLCILGPSQNQVQSWEASLMIEGAENMVPSWQVLGAEAINVGASETDLIVGTGLSPLTPNGSGMIPLLSMSALILGEDPIRFFIRPYPGSLEFPDTPGYSSEPGVSHECRLCGTEDFPSFTINWAAVDESRTWGEVKNLYD